MNTPYDRSVAGDSDTWMLFERITHDSYPLVVLARTGNSYVDHALNNGIVSMVICKADLDIVNDRGMPQHTDRIYPIEDMLARELNSLDVEALHVASITGDGERRMIYLHVAPLDVDPILQSCKVECYSLSVSVPTDRAALVELITPSAIDRQLNGDVGVISYLEKNGDVGATPRKADFWFYGERPGLERLAAELQPWGYLVDHWLNDPEGVVLTSETAVDIGTLREITPVLVASAEQQGVTYDGWETFVVRADLPEQELPAKPQTKSHLSKLFGAKN